MVREFVMIWLLSTGERSPHHWMEKTPHHPSQASETHSCHHESMPPRRRRTDVTSVPAAVPPAPPSVAPLEPGEIHPLLFVSFLLALLYLVVRPRPLALKQTDELTAMREAGQLAASVLEHLSGLVAPNVTTGALDDAAADYTASLGCLSAPLNYGGVIGGFLTKRELGKAACVLFSHAYWYASNMLPLPQRLPNVCGFPRSVCISVNDEVCHGIPDVARVLYVTPQPPAP